MGKIDGFLHFDRELPSSRDPKERIKDFKEIYEEFPVQKTKEQAARCMDCGIPFCHKGCPLGNIINGMRLYKYSFLPIISRSLRVVYARLLVKLAVYWGLTSRLWL